MTRLFAALLLVLQFLAIAPACAQQGANAFYSSGGTMRATDYWMVSRPGAAPGVKIFGSDVGAYFLGQAPGSNGNLIYNSGGSFTGGSLATLGIQPLDGELTALSGLTSAANKVPYFTGSGTASLADFSGFGRSLAAAANAADGRAALGIGALGPLNLVTPDYTDLSGLTDRGVAFVSGGKLSAAAGFTYSSSGILSISSGALDLTPYADQAVLYKSGSSLAAGGTFAAVKDVFSTTANSCASGWWTANSDVSTALQAHLAAHNGVAILPAGCYRLDTGLTIPSGATNFVVRALGNGPVTLYHKDNTTPLMLVDNTGNASSSRTVSSISQVTTNVSTVGDRIDRLQLSSAPTSQMVRGAKCFVTSDDPGIGQGTAPITAISAPGVSPVTVTMPGVVSTSTFANNATARVVYAQGMTQINNPASTYTLVNRSATSTTTTFELSGVDSTGWGTYTGGAYLAGVTFPGSSGARHGFLGEGFTILATNADSSTNTVDIYGQLKYHSFYTTNVSIRCPDPTLKVELSGFTISTNGDASGVTTTRSPAIKLMGVADPVVRNVRFEYPWAQSLWVQASVGGTFESLKSLYGINNPDKNQFTYGLNFYALNYAHVVRGLTQEQGRHGVSTDSSNNANTGTSWYNRGGPNDIILYALAFATSDGTGVDEHVEGFNIVFKGVNCSRPQRGSTSVQGTIQGACIQSRSLDPIYEDVTVSGGSRGISITQTDHGFPNHILANSLTCRGLTSPYSSSNKGQWADYCVEFDDQTPSREKTRLLVKNATLYGVGTGFYVNKNAQAIVDGLYAWNVDELGRLEGGARIDWTGSLLWDMRATSTAFLNRAGTSASDYNIGCYMRGDANYGGSSCLFHSRLETFKESDYAPYVIFQEHTGTGSPKNIYIKELVDNRASGIAATLVRGTGATTLTEAADVFPVTAKAVGTDRQILYNSGGTLQADSGLAFTSAGKLNVAAICDTSNANCTDTSAIASAVGGTIRPIDIPLFLPRYDASATFALPSSVAFFNTSTRTVRGFDLTAFTQCRLVANIQTVASTNAVFVARYLSSFSSTASAYLPMGSGSTDIDVTAASTGIKYTSAGWTSLTAGAKGDVIIALQALNGDGSTSGAYGAITLQCK